MWKWVHTNCLHLDRRLEIKLLSSYKIGRLYSLGSWILNWLKYSVVWETSWFLIAGILSTTGENLKLEIYITCIELHLHQASIMQPNWPLSGLLEVFILIQFLGQIDWNQEYHHKLPISNILPRSVQHFCIWAIRDSIHNDWTFQSVRGTS